MPAREGVGFEKRTMGSPVPVLITLERGEQWQTSNP